MITLDKLLRSRAPSATLLIRLAVGCIFLSEGIQKFSFPDQVGAGRFLKIGIPAPEVMAPFVGCFEILCGVLVLLGLVTRLAVIPLLCIMLVAIVTTKIPILLKGAFGLWRMRRALISPCCLAVCSCSPLAVGHSRWMPGSLLVGVRLMNQIDERAPEGRGMPRGTGRTLDLS